MSNTVLALGKFPCPLIGLCFKAVVIAAWFVGFSCHAESSLPLPEPLPGEQWFDGKDLNLDEQFAPILPLPDGRVLVFSRGGAEPRLLSLLPTSAAAPGIEVLSKLKIPYGHREGYSEQYPARYASVASRAGIWLLGATVELIRAGQSRLTGKLLWPRNNPKAVALDDGSVVVFGSEGWNLKVGRSAPERRSVERVSVGADGNLVSEFLPPLPSPCPKEPCDADTWISAFAVLHLGGGRIMLAGGYQLNGNPSSRVYLYEPSSRAWRTISPMKQPRTEFTLTLLPDGRVLAAGGNSDYEVGGMTTELWHPQTEQWTAGPMLPVPVSEHSALLWQGKTVLLAGGRFAGVLAWDIGAPSWRVMAQHALSRAGAGVALLSDNRLAIIGGRYARIYGEGWGRRTPGYSVLTLNHDEARAGLPISVMQAEHGAFAVRGSQLFAAGGLLTSTFDGSVKSLASAQVEIMDMPKGKVRNLPVIPTGAKEAQAVWLDDHRLLVLASGTGDRAPTWLGIIDAKLGTQTTMNLPPLVAPLNWQEHLKLIGIGSGYAWFLKNGRLLYGLDLNTSAVVEVPDSLSLGEAFTSRALADGRMVVVAARGANTYAIFDAEKRRWTHSMASPSAGESLAILRDGRVAKLGDLNEQFQNPENRRTTIVRQTPILEVSNASATAWKRLRLPPSLQGRESSSGCKILSVQGEGDLLGSAIFLGVPGKDGQLDWWWLDIDDAQASWQALGSALSPSTFLSSVVPLNWRGRKLSLIGGSSGIAAFEN